MKSAKIFILLNTVTPFHSNSYWRTNTFKKYKTRAVFTQPDETREGDWENSNVCVNPSRRRGFTQRLSSSPKLPRVFASGCVNTASVLYFFYKIYDKDSASCVYIA